MRPARSSGSVRHVGGALLAARFVSVKVDVGNWDKHPEEFAAFFAYLASLAP